MPAQTLASFSGGATHGNTGNITNTLAAASLACVDHVALPRAHLPTKSKLTLSLTVTNFLGQSGTTSVHVTKGGLPAPMPASSRAGRVPSASAAAT